MMIEVRSSVGPPFRSGRPASGSATLGEVQERAKTSEPIHVRMRLGKVVETSWQRGTAYAAGRPRQTYAKRRSRDQP
jgi:hypothetical protein